MTIDWERDFASSSSSPEITELVSILVLISLPWVSSVATTSSRPSLSKEKLTFIWEFSGSPGGSSRIADPISFPSSGDNILS